jgi:uncharacterized SAM-binding protein YcdF (DUF218 family)
LIQKALVVSLFLVGLLVFQTLVYVLLIARSLPFEKAGGFDLLVVFGGDDHRVQRALELERTYPYRYFMVSDSNPRQVEAYFRQFGHPVHARVLYEPLARTTDQNARYVSAAIRREDIHSALLVTSWYHIPRAWLLLKGYLLFQNVRLAGHISDHPGDPRASTGHFRQELFKFWGSLGRILKEEIREKL